MKGSLRQRGAASWELRVYAGTDPETRKRRYRTATVTGNRADAERALARLVADVQSDRTIGSASTVSELLEAWFAIACTSWAPTTTRETRSILDRCLHLRRTRGVHDPVAAARAAYSNARNPAQHALCAVSTVPSTRRCALLII